MDVYDLVEWCCFLELGVLLMDNNCVVVIFFDFICGYWDEMKGYKYVYVLVEEEEVIEVKVEVYIIVQKEVVVVVNFWIFYDNVKNVVDEKVQDKVLKIY